jgi:heme oxygenase
MEAIDLEVERKRREDRPREKKHSRISIVEPKKVRSAATPPGRADLDGEVQLDEEAGVMETLRASTRREHRALEAMPFNAALARGEIGARGYAALIEVQRQLHAAVEAVAPGHEHEAVGAVWSEELSKLEALDADRRAFPHEAGGPFDEAVERGRRFASVVGSLGPAAPWWLLGVLYVLEGSTLGGVFLRDRIARGLGVSPDALHYYGIYGRATKARWGQFCRRMEAAVVTPTAIELCVEGAREAFVAFGHIFESMEGGLPEEAASHRDDQDLDDRHLDDQHFDEREEDDHVAHR